MFSGKSKEIIDEADLHLIAHHVAGRDFLYFNHSNDNRYGVNMIASHNGREFPAVSVTTSADLLLYLFEPVETESESDWALKPELDQLRALYIDEGQFFDEGLKAVVDFIDDYYRRLPGRKHPLEIVVAGLDLDFRGEPFPGPMPDIMAEAEVVNKHVAICSVCNEHNATRTQRIISGKPANYNDPIILIGKEESYTARCPQHHEVPGKPQPQVK